ncbi:tRNA (adenosine(37)-N6)-threonylcarbamoyltransferase complex ATPase subunit type 1 TsaE [Algibacter sp. Ld11]|uniref:tRNA (adenosine(37)-N6)-threonylcarbamoyltransferase complex ATPase subunit type 1 TsaE n=1 Tax=Algibacter sp. Ld11 TaxID=649150 RepID=UPI003864B762
MNINYTIDEVEQVAKQLINSTTTRTLLFYGDMGVGKTTLIKAIVKALGSTDDVSSPTFSIVNEYELNEEKIFHFDLYRINDLEEAYNFGIEDYLDSDNWIIIEWPDIIEPILSGNENIIKLSIQSENQRQLIAK